MKKFKDYVEPHFENFKIVEVPPDKVEKIKSFVNEVIEAKKKESHHQINGRSEHTRFYTGTLGEAAMEEVLGVDIIDWTVGESATYNVGDLRKIGLDAGIKTVEWGKFPIIHKNPKRPEIINIKMDERNVAICGLATVDVLDGFQDDDLIIDPNLRSRGTKTGFYGFNKLMPFETLSDLKKLIR